MTLSCYIVDDEPHAIQHLQTLIAQTPGLDLCGFSSDPVAALAEIRVYRPAITFADIDMPVMSGLELAGLVSKLTQVIFTTAFRNFGPEAYEINAADYLLKPITYPRFWQAVEKIPSRLTSKVSPAHVYVKTGLKGVLQRIDLQNLMYISGLAAYVELQLRDEKYISYLSLQEVLEQLPGNTFCRIHKSYIVNQHFIQTIEGGQVRLHDGRTLPIGRSYRESFEQYLQPQLLISKRR